MSLSLLFIDEIRGFYKSKVMAVLWVGLPVITVIMHSIQPSAEGISFLFIVGLLVTSMGGLIGCVTIATSLSTELNYHVYDLFLIRPVKRASLLLAKFIAVVICILVALGFAFLAGFTLDVVTMGIPNEAILRDTMNSLSISIAAIIIACSLGILIGVVINSVAVSAIVAIYAGGQLSGIIALIPIILPNEISPYVFVVCMCAIVAPIILVAAISLFERKQL